MRKKMIRDLVLRVAVIVTATSIAVMATGCGSKNTETDSQNENVKNEVVSEQNEIVKSVEILGPVESNADKTIELNTKTIIEVSANENIYTFVAPETGLYSFLTLGNEVATAGTIYVGESGNGGAQLGNNMFETCEVKKGETVKIDVRSLDEEWVKKTLVVLDEAGANNFCGYVEMEWEYYSELGKELTISPTYLDLHGRPIDVTAKNNEVKWIRSTYSGAEESIEEIGTGATFTFKELKESDFIPEGVSDYYAIRVYKDGEMLSETNFYLRNSEGMIEFCEEEIYVKKGDKVTLEVKANEAHGEKKELDLSSDEYKIKWTIEDMDAEEIEPEPIKGGGHIVTINPVEDKHICGEYSNIIYAEVFRDGESIGKASFILRDEE